VAKNPTIDRITVFAPTHAKAAPQSISKSTVLARGAVSATGDAAKNPGSKEPSQVASAPQTLSRGLEIAVTAAIRRISGERGRIRVNKPDRDT